MECELLRSPMISYRSLLYNTTVLYDIYIYLYYGAWADQRVLPWYNYNTPQWYTMVAKGVNAR